jgi:hypothetical protein
VNQAIAVVKAYFAPADRFYFGAEQGNAGFIFRIDEVFVVSRPVPDFAHE